ncbi:MAG: ChaN family lipoprotein [Hyphomonadaceae bacterium]|nr:ChaN family lipoprotein [Hyphomonadaceae bacterium]
MHWRHGQQAHPLIGQVFKGDQPITIESGKCTRSPLQQLIVEVWDTIRDGGIVLLGEVHDNPEHHVVRGDILGPRLDQIAPTRNLHPAAVFEHIRTSQQAGLDAFYARSQRRRSGRSVDLLRELDWRDSGWPAAKIFYPLFDAALRAKLPIYPGNAERARMRKLVRGEEQPTDEEAARITLAQAMSPPLLDALAKELEGSHCGAVPGAALGAMSLAQRYTDAHLADALVRAAAKHNGAFLLAGNGHVRTDRAVPWYLRRRAPDRKVVAVMLLEVVEGKHDAPAYLSRAPDGTAAADYVVFTPRQQRPDPCEILRQGKP